MKGRERMKSGEREREREHNDAQRTRTTTRRKCLQEEAERNNVQHS